MIRPGLCSVTFRDLSPDAVIDLAAETGVAAIEWGGDVHLPPGDMGRAAAIRAAGAARGIDSCSYGSYVRAGNEGARVDFETVLKSVAALGAGNIRVWAGTARRDKAGEDAFATAAGDLAHMAALAQDRNITVSVEYHRNSLTEEAADTLALLKAAAHPNLFTYWQPVPGRGLARWQAELDLLAPHLGDLHVFHWIMTDEGQKRRPLAEGVEDWRALFHRWQVADAWPHPRTAFLEFVQDDTTARFRDDIRHLHALCGTRGEDETSMKSMGG
ncbi:sugar phosphate isomerase/epimerase family protein [Oceaniglobus trochenteri]|uniref:sugar phosphate isomerase/epimerase family protein n=1 Tax=Oceaniglobus trochenteri TaxID=2763260 RepID=UPI001CFFF543|nr:sugar phosphate isomerase/epimerase [Oceaniglobus trochenteri]